MIRIRSIEHLVLGVSISFAATSAQATVLTFDLSPTPANGANIGLTDTDDVPNNVAVVYGDRGAANSGDGQYTYSYGGPADTPNISVGYGIVSKNPDNQIWWSRAASFYQTGYSTLTNVIYPSNSDRWLAVMFKPDDGWNVVLNSVDVGSWGGVERTYRVQVWESIGDALDMNTFAPNFPVFVEGDDYNVIFAEDRTSSSVETFNINVSSNKILWLMVTEPSVNASLLGVDNISFSQIVPEPASVVMLGFGGLLLARCRRAA